MAPPKQTAAILYVNKTIQDDGRSETLHRLQRGPRASHGVVLGILNMPKTKCCVS